MNKEIAFELLVIYGLCFVCVYVNSQGVEYGCKKDACEKSPVKCNEFANKEKCLGRLIENATFPCGCCHLCVSQLKKGDQCLAKVGNRLPTQECGPALQCIPDFKDSKSGTCQDANTPCIKDRIAFDKASSGWNMGPPRPNCDEFGRYKSVACKIGMKCYCVSEDGKRIFGLAPYSHRDSMSCVCSREFESYKQEINKPLDVFNFLRCSETGDYSPYQCIEDNKCYCVDKTGNVTKRPSIQGSSIRNLVCENKEYNRDQFDTPCILEYKRKMAEIENTTMGIVLGIDLPSCDLDGSYSPVQCQDFECYCVDKEGERLSKAGILRNTKQAKTMTCNCLREKTLLTMANRNSDSEIFSHYECSDDGNYLGMQCTSSNCFCVNEMTGFQSGPSRLRGNRKDLECYDESMNKIFNIWWED